MKPFTNMLVAATSITFTLAMSACKKEMAQPNIPANLAAENTLSPAASLQRAGNQVLLSKEGNKTLSYYADNRLASVDYGNGNVKKYTYSSQFALVIADQTYNGVKAQQITYFLDASGKANKMKLKGYDNNGNALFEGEYEFTYLNGKLAEQKATKGFTDTYKFLYGNDGRLKWIEFYNTNGLAKKTRYFYQDYALHPEIADKIQSNPREAWLDEYLKIFGSFSTDLVMMNDVYVYKNGNLNTLDTYQFHYQLDNGYVKKREKTKYGAIQNILETINYSYITR
ncbi:MAG: hypothetical protein INR73_07075 [Williamsia sp.]|nr:hypothetical protein [Williamsia sp.]